jgi:alpha-mannosidase
VSTSRVSVTAIKRHEARDTLVVRLVNLTGEEIEETLSFGFDVREAWRTNLLEERVRELEVTGTRDVDLLLGAHEIVTLEIVPSSD